MAQTKLEKASITARNAEISKDTFNSTTNVYSVINPSALSDGKPWGKGTGDAGMQPAIPNSIDPITLIKPGLPTNAGGGLYDIKGVSTIPNSGREALTGINLYNSNTPYSAENIDMSQNSGQIQINYT
jgi:hypothetical protein